VSTAAARPRAEAGARPGDQAPEDKSRLSLRELAAVAVQGLRTRRLRASLSALGIAIGIGAMVAVVGVSASSQANLLALIDRLGTNLLTVTPGQTFLGANEVLPSTAVGSIDHMAAVQRASAVYQISNATVLRSPYVPSEQTGGIGVDATDPGLLSTLSNSMASGQFLNAGNERFPVVVLGAQAANTLQKSPEQLAMIDEAADQSGRGEHARELAGHLRGVLDGRSIHRWRDPGRAPHRHPCESVRSLSRPRVRRRRHGSRDGRRPGPHPDDPAVWGLRQAPDRAGSALRAGDFHPTYLAAVRIFASTRHR